MAVARKPSLRAVKPDEKPTVRARARRKKSVIQAAESGNHRDLLIAMRERIATTITDPNCPPRDLAALSRRLQEIAKEIDAIDLRAKQEAKEDAASADEDWDASAI